MSIKLDLTHTQLLLPPFAKKHTNLSFPRGNHSLLSFCVFLFQTEIIKMAHWFLIGRTEIESEIHQYFLNIKFFGVKNRNRFTAMFDWLKLEC